MTSTDTLNSDDLRSSTYDMILTFTYSLYLEAQIAKLRTAAARTKYLVPSFILVRTTCTYSALVLNMYTGAQYPTPETQAT